LFGRLGVDITVQKRLTTGKCVYHKKKRGLQLSRSRDASSEQKREGEKTNRQNVSQGVKGDAHKDTAESALFQKKMRGR